MSAVDEQGAALAARLRELLEVGPPDEHGAAVRLSARAVDAVLRAVGPLLEEAVAERVRRAAQAREQSPPGPAFAEVRVAVEEAVRRSPGPFSRVVDEVVSAVCALVRETVCDRDRLRRDSEEVIALVRTVEELATRYVRLVRGLDELRAGSATGSSVPDAVRPPRRWVSGDPEPLDEGLTLVDDDGDSWRRHDALWYCVRFRGQDVSEAVDDDGRVGLPWPSVLCYAPLTPAADA